MFRLFVGAFLVSGAKLTVPPDAVSFARIGNFSHSVADPSLLGCLCEKKRFSCMSRIGNSTTRALFRQLLLTKSLYCRSRTYSKRMDSITQALASLGVNDLPSIPAAHPDENPLDI